VERSDTHQLGMQAMMGIASHPSYTLPCQFREWQRKAIMARHLHAMGPDDPKEAVMNQPQPVKDASHLYEVERRAEHAARPGFRITELQLSAKQKVPWHTHTNVSDTFYVLEGHMRLFLQDPKEEVNLKPGEVYVVRPTRPHLVTNGGTKSLTFLVLQGVGEYDFVPLVSR
jgi:mannose-6-phosphate isomerase-like protein (cupin superfamily)